MNFIKQIFEGNADSTMHHKFVRFGKGEFERLYFDITKTKKNLKVKSSFGFANDFIKLIAENAEEELEVKGKIIVNRDFEKELEDLGVEIANYKKRGKLYTAEIDTMMKPETLKRIYEKFGKKFLLLSIKSDNYKLKTKASLPKPGGKIDPKFSNATLPLELLDEFVWDMDDFKKLEIKHIINIEEIVIPEEFKDDPAKARVEARRKGKIIRILKADDGEEKRVEAEFEA